MAFPIQPASRYLRCIFTEFVTLVLSGSFCFRHFHRWKPLSSKCGKSPSQARESLSPPSQRGHCEPHLMAATIFQPLIVHFKHDLEFYCQLVIISWEYVLFSTFISNNHYNVIWHIFRFIRYYCIKFYLLFYCSDKRINIIQV